jgi:hypothetical protein
MDSRMIDTPSVFYSQLSIIQLKIYKQEQTNVSVKREERNLL